MRKLVSCTAPVLALVLLGGCGSSGPTARQREVARRGAMVMPFDLDRTTHEFRPTSFGGVQTVVADDHSDRAQVRLVRSHLRHEQEKFAAGDFEDPMAIHGHRMPGVAVLRSDYRQLTVTYADVPAGGRLTYRAQDPVVVTALHDWFAAQLADHGAHAHAG